MSAQSEAVKRWRRSCKTRVVTAMGGACVCCGYRTCDAALALHHLDHKEKEFSFHGIRANPIGWSKIVKELRKCVLVCHNCHAEVHAGVRSVPTDAARFDEAFSDYKAVEKWANTHPCPCCKGPTPEHKEHCSRKCSVAMRRRNGVLVDWAAHDLKRLSSTMTVTAIARRLGCSDTSVHRKLRALGYK